MSIEKHPQLLGVVLNVRDQILRNATDKDSASFGYEEGVLLSANDAQILLDALDDLGNQLADLQKLNL